MKTKLHYSIRDNGKVYLLKPKDNFTMLAFIGAYYILSKRYKRFLSVFFGFYVIDKRLFL